MEFFEAIQEKFYAQSKDPGTIDFYQSICKAYDVDFKKFKDQFESKEARHNTEAEFIMNRQWGISGYPSVLLMKNEELHMVAHGYSTYDQMRSRIDALSPISKV